MGHKPTYEDLVQKIRQMEKKLAERYDLMSLITNTVPDLIWAKDLDNRYMLVNQAMCEKLLMCGSPDKAMGKTMDYFMDRQQDAGLKFVFREVWDRSDAAAIENTGHGRFLEQWQAPDRHLVLDIHEAPLFDEKGKPAGIVGCGRDITQEKEIKDALDRSEARFKDIERQLFHAQKMEAMGTLAGGIAHDFNNMLSPIIGYTEMVLDDVPTDSQSYENLNEVLKSANRAKDLVQQILSFSRQSKETLTPLKLQPVLDNVCKLLRATLPATIQIKRHVSRKCGMVRADPTQIHQVLMNLCTNAYHAMRKDGGLLQVTLAEVEAIPANPAVSTPIISGPHAKIAVSDTGCGIKRDILGRIFDTYFTTKAVGEGTGLGLAMVYSIVKKHGAEIRVLSEPGKGSVFDIYLPIVAHKEPEATQALTRTILNGDEHILLVDDELPILDMMKQMLERLGYCVTTRTNGAEAFETFCDSTDQYDLIITDMTMPGMTGVQLSKSVLEIKSGFPILLCTGYSEKINEKIIKKLGVSAYVMKPVVIYEMARTIREVLDKEK